MRPSFIATFAVLIVLAVSGCVTPDKNLSNNSDLNLTNNSEKYIVHKDITVTNFWVGEAATEDNQYIPNSMSAWDEQWLEHYGGIDDPNNRSGYYPAGFTPKENPFYFALPYNDLDENGSRKANIVAVYWANTSASDGVSILKNRWIKITHGSKVAYAQWEDVGPFEEDDMTYVFGSDRPKTSYNQNVGLDVSPAVKDYLGLEDIDKVDWQFIEEQDVPQGVWKNIITKRV